MFVIMCFIIVTNSIPSFGQTMNKEQLMEQIQRKSCFIQTIRSGPTPYSITVGSNSVITFDSVEHMDGYSSVSTITDRILLLIQAAVNYTFNQVCSRYTSYHASLPSDFCQNLRGGSSRVFGGVLNTTQEHLPRTLTGECQLPGDSSSAPAESMAREGLILLVSVGHEMGRLMSLAAW